MVKPYGRDYFYEKAKKNSHLARSYYKLQEADQKYALIKPGMRVMDLGCSPGSWIEYCLEKLGSRGEMVGIDRNEPKRTFRNLTFIRSDIMKVTPEQALADGAPFDLVLSDMAPDTTGTPMMDAYRSFELSMQALAIASETLRKGGTFFCKIFQGEEFKQFLEEVKSRFGSVKVFKPKASRKASREVYVVGMDKR